MLESLPWICIVGLLEVMSLPMLHSLMERVRLGAFIGGWMKLWSVDCLKLMHESYVAKVFSLWLFCVNLFTSTRL